MWPRFKHVPLPSRALCMCYAYMVEPLRMRHECRLALMYVRESDTSSRPLEVSADRILLGTLKKSHVAGVASCARYTSVPCARV